MAIATNELVKRIAAKSENTLTKNQVKDCICLLQEVIGDALKNGEEVQLTNIVTFNIIYRDAREGRNVRSGETMEIPESLMVSTKAGKGIKDALREADTKIFNKIKNRTLMKQSVEA